MNTLVVIGTSENVEAEYGSRADEAFTLLILDQGEVQSAEGFNTEAQVRAALADCHECDKEYLF